MPQIIFSDPDKVISIKEKPSISLNSHQVRIRTAYSYISAGTELTQIQMGAPSIKFDVQSNPMGYSLSGTVIEVGKDVTHVKVGDRVASLGDGAFHATETIVSKNLVVPIPNAVSMTSAAPAAMMCFALEAIRKAKFEFGENVLIVGAGLMGQFASQFAKACGVRVFMSDLNTHRLEKALPEVTTFLATDDGWDMLKEMTQPVGLEAAVVCLGGDATKIFHQVMSCMGRSPDGLQQGRIVFSGGANVMVPFASRIGNVQLLSSAKAGPGYRDSAFESGRDYPFGYVKWTVKRNVETVLRAVANQQIAVESLITHQYPFQDALDAYHKLAESNTDALGILLAYPE